MSPASPLPPAPAYVPRPRRAPGRRRPRGGRSTTSRPSAPAASSASTSFFVLSGFLITTLLVQEWRKHDVDRPRRSGSGGPAAPSRAPRWSIAAVCASTARSSHPTTRSRSAATLSRASLRRRTGASSPTEQSYFEQFGPPSPFATCGRSRSRSSSTWSGRSCWSASLLLPCAVAPVGARVVLGPSVVDADGRPSTRHRPLRASYGTDTRAYALLVGAAMAFMWTTR